MKKLLIMAAALMVSQASFAFKSSDELCKNENINKEAKNKVETTNHKALIANLGKVLLAGNPADCKFIKDNYEKAGWAMIDARNKSARTSTGVIKGTAKITSDHGKPKKDQFVEGKFSKKLIKFFKKKGEVVDQAGLKEKKLILFCNGLKCYRSTWGACSLTKRGYNSSNLYLVLDGYSGLAKCLKKTK